MTLPWLLALWRSDERARLKQTRSQLFAAGLGAGAANSTDNAEKWGQKLQEYDALIARHG